MFDVGAATRDEIPAVAAVLGEAFADDPVVVGMIGTADGRCDRATALYSALLRAEDPDGIEVDVARDRSGRILGAAVWERPEARGASLRALLRETPGFLQALGPLRLPLALRGWKALSRHRPDEPHWYLGEIGVRAAHRGTGVGSRLLAHRLRHVDDHGHGAYLESSTPRNRALYVRHGFEARGEIRGVHAARPTAMWRPPAEAAGPAAAR
ncbi:GNAT family N-acetyltransferase [Cellulomonas palmilytica]|uniref:GNAT family N-acetyltransferase n=1 Tax=Cellulomonas palmilytica TaxID=2608402 RepID=UPI001F4144E7|nr:GNAT family N-acetyltransferase [Cellulomonas palmilytica]UJP40213.1 GNAT family N-acetyltransferase [Cellulomonas palmilytica]